MYLPADDDIISIFPLLLLISFFKVLKRVKDRSFLLVVLEYEIRSDQIRESEFGFVTDYQPSCVVFV